MTTLKAAKDSLEQAVTKYKFCKAALTKAIAPGGTYSPRTLPSKLSKFETALQDLNSFHTSWISKGEFDETTLENETYSRQWLEGIWEESDVLMEQVDSKLSVVQANSTPPVLDNVSKLNILTKQMGTLQLDIDHKVSTLTKCSEDNITPATHKVCVEMLSIVKDNLSKQYVDLANDILRFDASRVDELELYRQKNLTLALTLEVAIAEKTPTSQPTSLPKSKGIEMEKSRAPTFSGRTIDYPEFKRGWNKVAGVCWDDGNQVEQLKLKVDQETRRIITRCKTMEEVWTTLDAEYAQEQEVVNAVNKELNDLRATPGSTEEYIVKLRQHLPNLEDTLKEVGGLEHLQTPDRVNMMVSRFDERTLHEWEYFRSKNKGTTYERFFMFLLDRYDAARSAIARRNSIVPVSTNMTSCSVCHHGDHSVVTCPHNHQVNRTHVTTAGVCSRCQKWTARDKVYTCPGCGRGTAVGQKVHHCLEHCGVYMSMTPNDRSNCVEKAKWCPVHLLASHQLSDCTMKDDPRFICGIDGCQKHHHKSLHHSNTSFALNVNATSMFVADNVMTLVQNIHTVSGPITAFWDNGSTCSLITKKSAARLQLHGEPVSITVETVTGKESMESHMFSITLVDVHGKQHNVTVFAVDKISNELKSIEIVDVKNEFSDDVQEKWNLLERPEGEIELLIGLNAFGLHPHNYECQGNLKVMSSQFGTGYLLGGSHPNIQPNKIEWSETVSNIRYSTFTVNKISVNPSYDFFEGEIMGLQAPKRCGNCLKCKDCTFRSQQLSQKEQYEFQIIESKVKYVESQQCFHVQYPFTDDPHVLKSNRGQVTKIAERLEKKLLKEGRLAHFNREFEKMVSGGALVELSQAEMDNWNGAVHYVSLQHVINEDSATTPLRIVANSSLSDRNGVSLNSILMKGPNTLSNQWEILNRWRMYEQAMCTDVTKAYWSLRTGEVEKHVRRVVWRDGDSQKQWRVFAFCVVSFGDKCAAAILEVAIKRTAQMNKDIDPDAALKIESDRYVDDIASGGTVDQVTRFVGDDATEGTVPKILARGGLRLKVIVTSGETNEEYLNKLGKSVLGIGWDAPTDSITINFTNNLKHPVETLLQSPFTMRICLSIVNSIYDPVGLTSPVTLRLKVAFRNLFRKDLNLSWDDAIPADDQKQWSLLLQMLQNSKSVSFDRCTKPVGVEGRCQLICYFDGSDDAYASVLYVRWNMMDGSVFTTILNSKSRTTPLQRISTPRSELNGAVVASRLVLSTLKSWSAAMELPERVWMIGDSECTLSSIEKVSEAFGEFFGNRIGEIQGNQAKIEEYCPVGDNGEWWFTLSENNGADIATRLDSSPEDIGKGSVWQTGPVYLRSNRSSWPVNRDFATRKNDLIPQCELLKKFRCLIQATDVETVPVGTVPVEPPSIEKLINPFATNSWDVLINRTQTLLMKAQQFKCLLKSKTICAEVSNANERMIQAKIIWFRTVMNKTTEALEKKKLKELDIQDRNGLKVVVGRAQTGLAHFFGKDHLPVIMGETRVAHLIMMTAHWKDHAGRDVTQAMARHEAWIVNARCLAKSVIRSCIRCRYLRKSLEMQKMAILPESIQIQCPPFTNIGLDLCGPLTVKAMTNKRATMKVWVVLFLCLNTKAISIELAPGYSTNDFLLAYMCHVNQRGNPVLVHSDRGSQLVAAHKEVCDDPLKYDWESIERSTSSQGTSWDFTPAGAQWRNGAAEAFVKKFKHSFHHLYRDSRLNYAELQCAVKRISNILNHRPVSVQRTKTDAPDSDFLSPLTPNMLITGRSASGPPQDYDDCDDAQVRCTYLEELERAWWYQYKVQYFESLVPTRKWLDAKRNICKGDVVLIEYKSKSAPGTYRLGKVVEAEFDHDGLVRTCTVLYKLVKPITAGNKDTVGDVVSKQVRVPVQRLVLILPVEEQ